MKKNTVHKPVLVTEVLTYLNPQPHKTYLDVTFGSGGHTRAILQADPTCKVIALDWDIKAIEKFGDPLLEEFGDRLKLIWGNFSHLYKIVRKEKIEKVDGVLADFGTSQVQLAEHAGFSFHHDTPLDMRMSPSHQKITAAEVLNRSSEEKLAELFFQLGEERESRTIARAIVQDRQSNPFETTKQLANLIERIIPSHRRKTGIHPATKVFQALRIFVNHELENIQSFLPMAIRLLNDSGRLVCISFHSLEDRIVKQFFQEQVQQGIGTLITKGAVSASEEEMAQNSSARSAKLRAMLKK
jgi:16S rRNA (cytosine1402-N4)-methyltransferase